jgi:hypothetical protein
MQNQFVDLYRNGIKTTTEIMKASLESSVRLQQRQLDIARNVLEESTRSADQLSEAKNMEDVMSLHSRLAGAQMERIAEFWSSLWYAATENQKTFIDQMQSQMGQTRERVRETYDFTARTSEEAARLAAAQVSKVTGSIRESANSATAQQERTAQHERSKPQEPHRKSA